MNPSEPYENEKDLLLRIIDLNKKEYINFLEFMAFSITAIKEEIRVSAGDNTVITLPDNEVTLYASTWPKEKGKCFSGKFGMVFLFTHFGPFLATGLFLYPRKTSENQRFSNVFRRYRKRPVG